MTNPLLDQWTRRTVNIRGEEIAVWPASQKITKLLDTFILMTRFEDVPRYHPELTRKVFEQEKKSKFKVDFGQGGCGTKIFHLDRWQSAEAELIHLRAIAFFSLVYKCQTPVVDVSMANIFRAGDYCLPHSHVRTSASLVYSVSCGNADPQHGRSGKLCIVDPRMPECCQEQEGRMTTPLIPDMQPGTMIFFPSEVMHFVTPYTGKKSPRISLAWNIDEQAVAGNAIPGGLPER